MFVQERKEDGGGSDWERCIISKTWYTIRLMEGSEDGTKWILLYIPDDENEIYYMFQLCSCGTTELRVMVNYPQYVSPGMALADYSLHLVGSAMTRTPELNVLWVRRYITGEFI